MRSRAALALCAMVLGAAMTAGYSADHGNVVTALCAQSVHFSPAIPRANPLARSKGRVKVPEVTDRAQPAEAYAVLHRAGLRVAFSRPASVSSLTPGVVISSPAAGTLVRGGSTVELAPESGPLGSPVVPITNPRFKLPNFVGCTLGQAMDWLSGSDLFWSIPALPSPQDNNVKRLWDAYRVVGQKPKPGTTLSAGVRQGGGFRPTPVIFTAVALPG